MHIMDYNDHKYLHTYVRTCVLLFEHTYNLSDDSDDNEHDATPLIKPASDPDISTALMTTTTTGSNKCGMKWLQHKAMNFFKAFCIPGVVVVRYGCFFMYLLVLYCIMIIIHIFMIAQRVLIPVVCLLLCVFESCELCFLLLVTLLS